MNIQPPGETTSDPGGGGGGARLGLRTPTRRVPQRALKVASRCRRDAHDVAV